MTTLEFAWRLWHRVRFGHIYYSPRTGGFDHRNPCSRCLSPDEKEPRP